MQLKQGTNHSTNRSTSQSTNRGPNPRKSGPVPELKYVVTERSGLLDFLIKTLTKLSRNNVKSLLVHGEVLVDDRVVTKHDYALKEGQTVRIVRSVRREQKQKDVLKILYEDRDLIVVNKPAGLLTIATEKESEITAYHHVTDYARRTNPKGRVFIVHRLDRDTSGVLLFAKNDKIKLALQDHWEELVSERSYVAVVEGQLREKSGRIRTWLKETTTRIVYSGKREGDGLEAITNYQVIAETAEYSLLNIQLETGRKNQIRVHMKEQGHPVVGDKKYGATADPLKRLGLHANRLALTHPFTGQPMRFEADLPKEFLTMFRNGKGANG